MTPAISLLIATYNWPRALELVLASVRAQRVVPHEVVIADDGSRDDTRALIAREALTFPCPVVHVWHEDTGFRLAAIRNKAIARARGDYVVQIDGDIVLHPAFVAGHARAARRGRYVQGSRALLSEAVTRRLLQGESVALGVRTRGLENRPNALYAPWLSPLVRGATDALRRTRGCHMAFWRDDLVRVNGYDEHIEGWGREDSELATRLINAGVRRRNLKFSAVAYHLWHTTANQEAVDRNHERVVRAQRERLVRAECGLDQYLDQSLGPHLASPESIA
jgi:glycosyltransferase involved in cell wall biosynthesis